MPLAPPPRIVEKFEKIWRDWLYFLSEFLRSHTGGATPTPPATGTDWNAHGNDAVGTNTVPLTISVGAFQINSSSGRPTIDLDDGTGFAFIPTKKAIRSGEVPSLGDYWTFATIGKYSGAFGLDVKVTGQSSYGYGETIEINSPRSVAGGYDITIDGGVIPGGGGHVGLGQNLTVNALSGVVLLGKDSSGTNISAIGVGSSNNISSEGGVGVGTFNDVAGQQSTLAGFNNKNTSGRWAACFGANLEANAESATTIGAGFGEITAEKLVNANAFTLWMGTGSNVPTFIMKNNSPGLLSLSKIGIVEQNPNSTFEVAGSVGYKYTHIAAGAGKTIGASDNELTFLVDCTGAVDNTINLPAVSGIDRRIYYFKKIRTAPGASGLLILNPNGTDTIEASSGGNGLQGNAGVALSISGNAVNLFVLADATTGGWWIL